MRLSLTPLAVGCCTVDDNILALKFDVSKWLWFVTKDALSSLLYIILTIWEANTELVAIACRYGRQGVPIHGEYLGCLPSLVERLVVQCSGLGYAFTAADQRHAAAQAHTEVYAIHGAVYHIALMVYAQRHDLDTFAKLYHWRMHVLFSSALVRGDLTIAVQLEGIEESASVLNQPW